MNMLKWLSISDRYTKMYLDRQLAPLGINSGQHMYVIKICDKPGISQQDFIESFYVNPSNVTRAISTLEKGGYLERRTAENDKRAWNLYPTEKAMATYPDIQKAGESWEAFALAGLTEAEKAELAALLEKVGRRLIGKLTF